MGGRSCDPQKFSDSQLYVSKNENWLPPRRLKSNCKFFCMAFVEYILRYQHAGHCNTNCTTTRRCRFFLRYECYRPPSPHCLEPLLSFMLDTCMTQFSALKGLVIERSLTLTALVFVKIITRQLYTHFNTFLSKPCS